MDKFIRDIDKGNLLKDELFIVPYEINLPLIGSYTHKILWIVNKPNAAHIDEDDVKFCNSILAQIPGMEANIENIGWINLENANTAFLNIMTQYKPESVFIWGANALIEGISKGHLVPEFMGNCKLIQCPDISSVRGDKEAKVLLWNSMKAIYNID